MEILVQANSLVASITHRFSCKQVYLYILLPSLKTICLEKGENPAFIVNLLENQFPLVLARAGQQKWSWTVGLFFFSVSTSDVSELSHSWLTSGQHCLLLLSPSLSPSPSIFPSIFFFHLKAYSPFSYYSGHLQSSLNNSYNSLLSMILTQVLCTASPRPN